MNITEEKTGELTATLKFEVVEADYTEKYQQELKSHRRQASMPGFRAGKVPMGIIQKKYGTAILLDEVNKFVSDELNKHIKEKELNIMGYPLPNAGKEPQDFMKQKDFTFYFDIGFAPKIDLDLQSYEPVDYFKIKVDDSKIDEQIKVIQDRNSKTEGHDIVGKGDMLSVKIDELDDEGNVKEGGINKETMVLVDFLKNEEIQEKVLGLKVGDAAIFNPLVATGNEAETATMLGIDKEQAKGITNDFRFDIVKIETNIPAEVGEELFKLAYPNEEIKTEEEFRDKIAEEIAKSFDVESQRLFSRFAMDKLFDATEINLPDEFLKKWLFESNQGKVSVEDIEKNYDGYRKAMKMELIENDLIKKEPTIRVTDDDLKVEIKNYFKGYFMPNQPGTPEVDDAMNEQLDQIADDYLKKNKEETQRIHDELFSRRLSGFLKNEIKLNEKEISFEDFGKEIEKLTAHLHNHDHDHDIDHDHEHDHEHDEEK